MANHYAISFNCSPKYNQYVHLLEIAFKPTRFLTNLEEKEKGIITDIIFNEGDNELTQSIDGYYYSQKV